MPGAHAMLGASGAKRWLSCPPSAMLNAKAMEGKEEESSVFAQEGTVAHELAEAKVRKMANEVLGELKGDTARRRRHNRLINKIKKDNAEFFNEEMDEATDTYVSIIEEKFNEALSRSPDAEIFVEQKIDYSRWVPDGWGTADCAIIADGRIEVIDLKYGKGIPVSAIDNPQIRLYSLGAYELNSMLYDIDSVGMTIIQPRLDSVSTESMSITDLVKWAEDEVVERAEQAAQGIGEFCAGEHCRWCAVKATCKARANYMLELAKLDFRDPALLTNKELTEVYLKGQDLAKWVKDVLEWMQARAEEGVKFDGFKLVEGRSTRKISDPDELVEKLREMSYEDKQLFDKKLKSLTALEKLVGKKAFAEHMGDLIIKPAGKPTLVPESDKRPEMNGTESAKNDFKQEA